MELFPDNLPTLLRLAQAEERIGNWDEAERIYKDLIQRRYRTRQMGERLEVVRKARELERSKAMWHEWVDKKDDKK